MRSVSASPDLTAASACLWTGSQGSPSSASSVLMIVYGSKLFLFGAVIALLDPSLDFLLLWLVLAA